MPWAAADYAETEEETNELLQELGLPARPAGRVWLLRHPGAAGSVDELLGSIWTEWQESGGVAMATADFVTFTQSRLYENE